MFDNENGRKFSEWVEDTVGKEEIARYEQFLLSHSVFKKLFLQTRENQGLFWERAKGYLVTLMCHNDCFNLYQTIQNENVMGKGENAGNLHFLFFSTIFSFFSKRNRTI